MIVKSSSHAYGMIFLFSSFIYNWLVSLQLHANKSVVKEEKENKFRAAVDDDEITGGASRAANK